MPDGGALGCEDGIELELLSGKDGVMLKEEVVDIDIEGEDE